MKKLFFLLVLIGLSVGIGYSLAKDSFWQKKDIDQGEVVVKEPLIRFALVSDSHNENGLLAKALEQAKGKGVNFVIGLGDWTNTGTVEELGAAKKVFDNSRLEYFVTAGDHDLWDSRDKQEEPLANFRQVFGQSSQIIERENVLFVLLDNSDIYKGIDAGSWSLVTSSLSKPAKLHFVMAQKTPFHPESKHIMGSENAQVAEQAKRLLDLLETPRPCHSEFSSESSKILKQVQDDEDSQEEKVCPAVDGFFSGDLHFFAQFSAKGGSTSGGKSTNDVKITTVGAVASERNFQGPRFAIVTVWEDYSFDVEDVEIRMDANR